VPPRHPPTPPANPRRSSWCHLVPLGLVVPSLVPLSSSFQMAPAASAGGARRAGPGADQRRHHLARVRAPPHHPGVHRATHRARVHRDRAARLRGPATVQECSMSKQRALVTVPAASAAKSCARSRRAEPRCSPATSTSRRSVLAATVNSPRLPKAALGRRGCSIERQLTGAAVDSQSRPFRDIRRRRLSGGSFAAQWCATEPNSKSFHRAGPMPMLLRVRRRALQSNASPAS